MRKSLPYLLVVLALTAQFTGCSSKTAKKNSASSVDASDNQPSEESSLSLNGDSDSSSAGGLSTVYFPYDSAAITKGTREALNNNAEFLKSNDGIEVQVEGHCDERGGVQYNLALGERRANAVKNYLVAMGVSSKRISKLVLFLLK